MSAYVLSHEQFCAIYTAIEMHRDQQEFQHLFRNMLPTDCLIEEWRNMNIEAVCQRYPDDKPEDYPQEGPFTITDKGLSVTPVKLFALLECLVYQCSEGDVPQSRTYFELDDLTSRLARTIVGNLRGYDWSL